MPGLCGGVGDSIEFKDRMKECMLHTSNLVETDIFSDDFVWVSGVFLRRRSNCYFINDNIVIYINGLIFNKDYLNKMFNCCDIDFSLLIYQAYRSNKLNELLCHANGNFELFIYDRNLKKIYLISDRRGSQFTYYYAYDGKFIFSGEVKSFIECNGVDFSIDRDAVACFAELGRIIEDRTYFKYIKLVKPATILEYDINSKNLTTRRYWLFSNIVKNKITFDDAARYLGELLQKSVLERYVDGERMLIQLSGGYDSRMIFSSFLMSGCSDINLVTFGQRGCFDIGIASNIARQYKCSHDIFYLSDDEDVLDIRKEFVWLYDGMYPILDMHGMNLLFDNSRFFNNFDSIFSGVVAGEILGFGIKPMSEEFYDKKPTCESLKHILKGSIHMCTLEDDSYYNIDCFHPYILDNIVRRFSIFSQQLSKSYFSVKMPYLDNNILDFIFSVPDSYKRDGKLYHAALNLRFSEFYKRFPIASGGKSPIFYSKTQKRFYKLLKIFRKMMGSKNQHRFFDYDRYVLRFDNQEKFAKILFSQNNILSSLEDDFFYNYLKNHYNNIRYDYQRILNLLTLKIYFDKLEDVLL